MDVEAVIKGYIDCGLWTSSCNGTARGYHANPDQCNGEDCDQSLSNLNFDQDDLGEEAMMSVREDVEAFLATCDEEGWLNGLQPEQVGHDFWLTRNGHGTGFWDRGLGVQGDRLTKMAKPYGECHLFVLGGKVHYES